MKPFAFLLVMILLLRATPVAPAAEFSLSRADYVDRVQAIWTGQMLAVILGVPFENKTATVVPLEKLPFRWMGKPVTFVETNDDFYYEMAAVRGFEKYGIGMTVEQLGDAWLDHDCGAMGSSGETRKNLLTGIRGADAGHPRHNKLWFTIGPQFSCEVYGALAPGMPNVAGRMAREYGRLNGHAEAVDGAVFTASMISLGFVERDTREIVRQAVNILDASSPFRQCIELVISMATAGRPFGEIVETVEDRWHSVYPATNNSVANGGIVAAAVWFGGGDFWRTMNLVCGAADFTDADCNAANAAAVIGAMHGMKALPRDYVTQLNDRIVGQRMQSIIYKVPVDESISGLARRTAAIGEKIVSTERGRLQDDRLIIPIEKIVTQPPDLFSLGDLMKYWNPDWTLERAGYGGGRTGIAGNRGLTHLQGDILATYPRDEVRACLLRRTLTLGDNPRLSFDAGAEPGRAWELDVYADNVLLVKRTIIGDPGARKWHTVDVDLKQFAGRQTTLRLYQRVLIPNRTAGNALWRNLNVK